MSHSVVIIDRDGNETLYYPPHNGDLTGGDGGVERLSHEENPLLICSWSDDEQFKKLKKKLMKNIQPQSAMSPELLAEVKEIFG